MKKPIIGISLDHEDDKKYSQFPYYAIRENYIEAVKKSGGTPVLLPFDINSSHQYINIIDGLIITGGNFDISPNLYGQDSHHEKTSLKVNRTKFEYNITKSAIDKNIPILGICGGMQLLNVILGGNLIQHIPEAIKNCLEHEAKPYDQYAHEIIIEKETQIFKFANKEINAKVNSSHHQAVNKLGKDLIVSAKSSDGVIEAIEHINHKYLIGVQWHPEYLISNLDQNIFDNFIKNSAK